jgi:hypothetical protein
MESHRVELVNDAEKKDITTDSNLTRVGRRGSTRQHAAVRR